MTRRVRDMVGLVVALAVPLAAGGLGGAATSRSVNTWYRTLRKPAWQPPGWLFGPVWTLLYILMGVASWQVWRQEGKDEAKRQALEMHGAQLSLNLLWSVLFFGLRRVDLALIDIVMLWSAILATAAKFYRIKPVAGLLLLPYQLWVSFATALNAAIWLGNR